MTVHILFALDSLEMDETEWNLIERSTIPSTSSVITATSDHPFEYNIHYPLFEQCTAAPIKQTSRGELTTLSRGRRLGVHGLYRRDILRLNWCVIDGWGPGCWVLLCVFGRGCLMLMQMLGQWTMLFGYRTWPMVLWPMFCHRSKQIRIRVACNQITWRSTPVKRRIMRSWQFWEQMKWPPKWQNVKQAGVIKNQLI